MEIRGLYKECMTEQWELTFKGHDVVYGDPVVSARVDRLTTPHG